MLSITSRGGSAGCAATGAGRARPEMGGFGLATAGHTGLAVALALPTLHALVVVSWIGRSRWDRAEAYR